MPAVRQPQFVGLGRYVVAQCLVEQDEHATTHARTEYLRNAGDLLDAVNAEEVSHTRPEELCGHLRSDLGLR